MNPTWIHFTLRASYSNKSLGLIGLEGILTSSSLEDQLMTMMQFQLEAALRSINYHGISAILQLREENHPYANMFFLEFYPPFPPSRK